MDQAISVRVAGAKEQGSSNCPENNCQTKPVNILPKKTDIKTQLANGRSINFHRLDLQSACRGHYNARKTPRYDSIAAISQRDKSFSSPSLQKYLDPRTKSFASEGRPLLAYRNTNVKPGQSLVKPHPIPLKVVSSGINEPGKRQTMTLVSNFKPVQQTVLQNKKVKIIPVPYGGTLHKINTTPVKSPSSGPSSKDISMKVSSTRPNLFTRHPQCSRQAIPLSRCSNTEEHNYTIPVYAKPALTPLPNSRQTYPKSAHATNTQHQKKSTASSVISFEGKQGNPQLPRTVYLNQKELSKCPTYSKTKTQDLLTIPAISFGDTETPQNLSAASLQNGLQKVLDMTSFGYFLDEDSPKKLKTQLTSDNSQIPHQSVSPLLSNGETDYVHQKEEVQTGICSKNDENVGSSNSPSQNATNAKSTQNDLTHHDIQLTCDKNAKSVNIVLKEEIKNMNDHEKASSKQCDTLSNIDSGKKKEKDSHRPTYSYKSDSENGLKGKFFKATPQKNKPDADAKEGSPNKSRSVSKKTDSSRTPCRKKKVLVTDQNGTTMTPSEARKLKRLEKLMDDCYTEMLYKWEKYLLCSPNTMRVCESNNALCYNYNPDAYCMVSNPDLSVWKEIEDLTPRLDLSGLDLFPDDYYCVTSLS